MIVTQFFKGFWYKSRETFTDRFKAAQPNLTKGSWLNIYPARMITLLRRSIDYVVY